MSRQRTLHEFDIATLGIVNAEGLSHFIRRGTEMLDLIGRDQVFDAQLKIVLSGNYQIADGDAVRLD